MNFSEVTISPTQRELMDIKTILDLHFPQETNADETTAQTVRRLLMEYKELRALLNNNMAELPIADRVTSLSSELRDSKQILLEINDKFEQAITDLEAVRRKYGMGK